MTPNTGIGRLIVVSGPSGVGKGTVLKRVFEQSHLPLVVSISATTRMPRNGEVQGTHYHFLTHEEFQRKRENDEFLECFEVFKSGHWYGTLKEKVLDDLNAGKWVVLEIDVQGARAVRSVFPNAITIFIEPKNGDVLRERLIGRNTESDTIIEERLLRAAEEMKFAGEYDYRIVNDHLETAVSEFCRILDKAASAN